jgi:type I restriction-modification system DNA methylase subunit
MPPATKASAILEEGLSRKNTEESKSGFGQYFTSQPLVDLMVAVMNPQVGDHVNDSAAGTFGFIIATDLSISSPLPRSKINPIMAELRIFMRIANFRHPVRVCSQLCR